MTPAPRSPERLEAARAFFGPRAATWDERFPDDDAAYREAVRLLAPRPGAAVLDAGCGTGRALRFLREAVGPGGLVVGIDVTAEMLASARARGRDGYASLVLADVEHLAVGDASLDAVLAAGLVSHLSEVEAGLRELARITRAGGRLALFHPIGRAALARRHGRALGPDDVRAEDQITAVLAATSWRALLVDDAIERYLVVAERVAPPKTAPRAEQSATSSRVDHERAHAQERGI